MSLDLPKTLKNSLNMSDSALYDFIIEHPTAAHIKDSKTGKYLLANNHILKHFGRENIEDFIYHNIYDVDKFMRPYWGNKYAQKIDDMDNKVATNCAISIENNDIILNARNEICIQDILKLPLINNNNKVIAILSIINDATQNTDLFQLFSLYINMHKNKKSGIASFIKYLGLDNCFHQNPTLKETICLLHMRIDPAHKNIANKMNIGVKTVEYHVSHITNKLKNSQLSSVLSHLRSKKNP